jgi:uncharacterized protein (TIGR03086 family)
MNVEMYQRALKRTGEVVGTIRPERFGDPTPCTDWDVRTLLNHTIGGCASFAAGAEGNAIPMDGEDYTQKDHVAAFEDAAESSLAAFRAPNAMESTFVMPWGETPGALAFYLALADATIHGWDLAQATGQNYPIDADIAEYLYQMTTSMLAPRGDYPRGDMFREPVEVAPDALPGERLLAYMGRRPSS